MYGAHHAEIESGSEIVNSSELSEINLVRPSTDVIPCLEARDCAARVDDCEIDFRASGKHNRESRKRLASCRCAHSLAHFRGKRIPRFLSNGRPKHACSINALENAFHARRIPRPPDVYPVRSTRRIIFIISFLIRLRMAI